MQERRPSDEYQAPAQPFEMTSMLEDGSLVEIRNSRGAPPPTARPPPRSNNRLPSLGRKRGSASNAGVRAADIRMELYDDRSQPQPARPFPYFCCFAITACCTVMLLEIRTNGWKFQPFSCSQADGP